MMTTMVTLVQTTERDALAAHPVTGRLVAHENALLVAVRRLRDRLTPEGFRSRGRISSVAVPGVDFRSDRSSSV